MFTAHEIGPRTLVPRILIVARNDYLARVELEGLFEAAQNRRYILHALLVEGDGCGHGGSVFLRKHWERSAPRYFAYELTQHLALRWGGRLCVGEQLDVEAQALRIGVPVLKTDSVNSREALAFAREFRPDLLVCVKCPARLGATLLRLAPCGGINAHASILPAHAGRAPHFWTLASGDRLAGVTIHRMEAQFDAGPVLAQRELSIPPGLSAFELLRSLTKLGSDALLEGAERALRHEPGRAQLNVLRTYHSYPNRSALRQFKQRGHRLIRKREILRVLLHERRRAKGVSK